MKEDDSTKNVNISGALNGLGPKQEKKQHPSLTEQSIPKQPDEIAEACFDALDNAAIFELYGAIEEDQQVHGQLRHAVQQCKRDLEAGYYRSPQVIAALQEVANALGMQVALTAIANPTTSTNEPDEVIEVSEDASKIDRNTSSGIGARFNLPPWLIDKSAKEVAPHFKYLSGDCRHQLLKISIDDSAVETTLTDVLSPGKLFSDAMMNTSNSQLQDDRHSCRFVDDNEQNQANKLYLKDDRCLFTLEFFLQNPQRLFKLDRHTSMAIFIDALPSNLQDEEETKAARRHYAGKFLVLTAQLMHNHPLDKAAQRCAAIVGFTYGSPWQLAWGFLNYPDAMFYIFWTWMSELKPAYYNAATVILTAVLSWAWTVVVTTLRMIPGMIMWPIELIWGAHYVCSGRADREMPGQYDRVTSAIARRILPFLYLVVSSVCVKLALSGEEILPYLINCTGVAGAVGHPLLMLSIGTVIHATLLMVRHHYAEDCTTEHGGSLSALSQSARKYYTQHGLFASSANNSEPDRQDVICGRGTAHEETKDESPPPTVT